MPWFVAAATAVACGGKALDVGSDEPKASAGTHTASVGAQPGLGMGGTGTGGTLSAEDLATIQWPAEVECNAAPSSPLVGKWKGHWPDNTPYGSHDVVLTISGLTPDGVPCGTVRIGEGSPPAPATDPDVIYPDASTRPSGFSYASGGSPMYGIGPPIIEPWQGYDYQMLSVESSGSRLAFTITYGELLRSWCALQTAHEGSFSCLPEITSWAPAVQPASETCLASGPNLPQTELPCWKIQYCSSYSCFCYDGSCDAALAGSGATFELHWDGPALEGSVNGGTLIFLDPVTP